MSEVTVLGDTRLRLLFKVLLILFAVVGVVVTCRWMIWRVSLPHSFAPDRFLIVDIYDLSNAAVPEVRVYLDGASPADVRFEGDKLTHHFEGRPHPQAGILLPGCVVSGKGRIVFGSAVLSIDGRDVFLNGRQLSPREVIVSRSGSSREGTLKIAR